MRTTLMVLVASIPLAACSDALVTAPPPLAAAPVTAPPLLAAAPAMASALPIFIVDGVVVQQSDIPLSTADIERIEIIKGAAATTLYGAPMLCPAIIIRTRRPPR